MRILRWTLPFIVLIGLFNTGCKKDVLNGDGALTFSLDTVIFDTVFTTIGSITKQFKIYNPSNNEVNISSIILAGGQQSKYRLNVDGVPGTAFSNVSIPGRDSLFVFVDVTLDPNNLSAPAIVTDSVLFNTSGNLQDVDLVACGWDAHFIYPTNYLSGLGPYSVIECDTLWTSNKPHVIYGYAVVDSACTLTIEQGSHIYSHKHSGMLVFTDGTLIVNGTTSDPVEFASDRLDEFYEDQAGEWDRIWFFQGSKDNVIDNAIIKNGNVGLQVDYISEGSPNPTLRLSNTLIENMAGASLFSQTGSIDAYNCVFGNAGQYSAALSLGGDYAFRHCTFANYWVNGNRQTPAVLLNNWYEPDGVISFDMNAYFGNCIIYGNNQTELGVDENTSSTFSFEFDNCLLRADDNDVDVTDPLEFHGMTYNENPKFVDPSEQNFELDTLSTAMDAGSISIVNALPELQLDIIGNSRVSDTAPDLGAYERQE